MAQEISTFLMFDGRAEEAVNFYVSLFPGAHIVSIQRYGSSQGAFEGKVLTAVFMLGGQRFMCSDSTVKHDFGFTPSVSLFVNVESEEDLDRLFASLSDGGKVLMPLSNYGFSRKFGWLNDRFGVSWQLNLPS